MAKVVHVCMPYSAQPQVASYWLVPFDEAVPCRIGCGHPQVAPPPVEDGGPSTECVFYTELNEPAGTPLSQHTPDIGGPLVIVGAEPTIEDAFGFKVMRGPNTNVWSGFVVPGLADVDTDILVDLGNTTSSAALVRLRDENAGDIAGNDAVIVFLRWTRFQIIDDGVTVVDEVLANEQFQRITLSLEGSMLTYSLADDLQTVIVSGSTPIVATGGTDFAVLTRNPGDPVSQVFASISACPVGVVPAT